MMEKYGYTPELEPDDDKKRKNKDKSDTKPSTKKQTEEPKKDVHDKHA